MMTTQEEDTDKKLVIKYFTDVIEKQLIDPKFIQSKKFGKGQDAKTQIYGIDKIFSLIDNFSDAITIFQQKSGNIGKWNIRLDGDERIYIIARVILLCLINTGEFIQDQFNQYYYFNKLDSSVVLVCESNEQKKMNGKFESSLELLFNLRKRYKIIHDSIINYVIRYNTKMNIYRLWHYDKKEHILYVYGGGNIFFKLDGTKITTHHNGEGILFKESNGIVQKQYIPLELREQIDYIGGLKVRSDNDLLDVLINRCNFTKDSNLSPDEQKTQLLIHILALPYSSIIHTKPIMIFKGNAGSGKSFTLQTIGKFFFGDKYALSLVPEKIKDYTTALINRPVYFSDNVDIFVKWLPELIVAISTGARLPQRELYTNSGLIEDLPECFLAFTTRTGYTFKRDDIIDRALLFHVDKFKITIPEQELWEPLKYRNQLFSEYLDLQNKIILYMKNNPNIRYTSTHRISGWAKFGSVVKEVLDLETLYSINFNTFLDHIHNEKATFGFHDKKIIGLLKRLMATNDNDLDNYLFASQIIDKIKEFEPDFDYSTSKMGKLLNNQREQLNQLFGLDIKIDSNSKTKVYRFGKKNDGDENKNSNTKQSYGASGLLIESFFTEKNNIKIPVVKVCKPESTARSPVKKREFKNHSPKIKYMMEDVSSYLSKIENSDGIFYDEIKQYFVFYKKWEECDLKYILNQMWDIYGSIKKLAGNRYQISE